MGLRTPHSSETTAPSRVPLIRVHRRGIYGAWPCVPSRVIIGVTCTTVHASDSLSCGQPCCAAHHLGVTTAQPRATANPAAATATTVAAAVLRVLMLWATSLNQHRGAAVATLTASSQWQPPRGHALPVARASRRLPLPPHPMPLPLRPRPHPHPAAPLVVAAAAGRA